MTDKNLRNFNLSQQAVILNADRKVLILKTSEQNVWLLPGGRVDIGDENLYHALSREIKEETNFELKKISNVIGTDISTGGSTFAVAYLCLIGNFNDFQLSHEHKEYKWVEIEELERYLFYKKIAREIVSFFNKDEFDRWNDQKKIINMRKFPYDVYFHTREVWWCALGQNVGVETNGKHEIFERPVLIVKKFNTEMVWVVPLGSNKKSGKYYIELKHDKGVSYANLSQLKLISTNRLNRKLGMIHKPDFQKVLEKYKNFFETSKPPYGGFSEAEATNGQSISDRNTLSSY